MFVHARGQILHQTQANIVDLSNELKLYQKEAKAAKELRLVVADLQTEILKAGELIATYRNKLIEYIPLTTNHVQQEMMSATYLEELESMYIEDGVGWGKEKRPS